MFKGKRQGPIRPMLKDIITKYNDKNQMIEDYLYGSRFEININEYLNINDFISYTPGTEPLSFNDKQLEEVSIWNKFLINLHYDLNIPQEEEENKITEFYQDYYKINGTNYKYIYVTIRPKAETTFNEFYKKTKKLLSKKWITEYYLVFEQSGKTKEEIGKGFHLHALFNLPPNKKHSRAREEIYSTFQHQCGLAGVKVDPVKLADVGFNNCLKYMGIDTKTKEFIKVNTYDFKNKPEKFEALKYDEIFRKENDLKTSYSINNPII